MLHVTKFAVYLIHDMIWLLRLMAVEWLSCTEMLWRIPGIHEEGKKIKWE